MLITELSAEYPGVAWIDILNEAIRIGAILEIEYTLPFLSFRIKSFLLPAGTKIHGH